jgi:hypothetical protein
MTTLTDYRQCKLVEFQLTHVAEYQQVVELYFQPQDVERALRIIYCESSGNQYAINKNKNGTTDKGIWQFNDMTWKWLSSKFNFNKSRYNINFSTKMASWLVYNDSWKHWNSSKHCWGNNATTG